MLVSDSSTLLVSDLCEKLRVLADVNRMKIMLLLRDGERCVCDIVDSLDLPQSLVSHHLSVMRSAGILRDRRSGRWIYYSVDRDGMIQLSGLLQGVLNPAEISTAPAADCDDSACCGR